MELAEEQAQEEYSFEEAEVAPQEPVDEAPEVSEVEQEAYEQGWRPQDQWKGNPEEWKDAKTFVREGEMMERIQRQGKAIDQHKKKAEDLERTVRELAEHNKKIAQLEFDKAVKHLKKQKADALHDGDYDAVVDIDDQLDDLKSQKNAQEPVEDTAPEVSPDQLTVQSWIQDESNSWYREDYDAATEADRYFDFLGRKDPDMPIKDRLVAAERHVKKKFPSKFGKGPTHQMVAEPNTAVSQKTSSKKYTKRNLSEEQLQVGNRFVKGGAYKDIQEYVDALAELGELE